MALKFNNVAPTEIIVKRSDQEPISFASGSTYVTPKTLDSEGYWIAQASFTQYTDFTLGNIVYCNGEKLTSYPHVMHTITRDNTTYTFSAAYHESTSQIYTTQKVVKRIKSNAGLTVYGEDYTGMFTADTNLTVLKYSVKEGDLSGEATRASVSSYSKAALDGYVGLVNDTWGSITNASSLTKDKYYYIRVLVTDTNRYGKFCIRFKSYNGQTITTDNIGWGYDGEVIATIPVWGKPFPLTIQAGANSTVTVNRTSSPNQHANTGTVTSGGIVYYGDTLTITATPASGYKLTKFTINGTEYASGQTSVVSQTITVTSAVSIVSTTESAASWRTYWTGSLTYGFDTIHMEEYTTTNYFPSSFFKQTPFRITGSYYVGNNAYGGGKPTRGTFADKELPYNTGTYGTSYAKVELVEIGTSQYQIKITCHTDGYLNSYVSGGLSQITITKLDIYD